MSDTRWNVAIPKSTLVAPWRRQPPPEVSSDPPERVTAPAWEEQAIAILVNRFDGESASIGFARKERELVHLFATLSIEESRALHERLRRPEPGDELAGAIGRLVPERRARIVAFVADARRRAAVIAERVR